MTKIYINKVHEDNGWTFSFGTKGDVVAWEEQKREWEAQELCCDSDSVEVLGDAKNIDEAINLINQAIEDNRKSPG